jgi:hypothetical protein
MQVATLEAVKDDQAVQFRTPEPCADGKLRPTHKINGAVEGYQWESQFFSRLKGGEMDYRVVTPGVQKPFALAEGIPGH